MKKLVYWGIGKVGKACVRFCSENVPEFIIDSNCIDKEYKGIPIHRPEYVNDWNDLFVVITVDDHSSIKQFLEEKNMIENVDFQVYTNFFNVSDETVEESIARLKKNVCENNDLLNRTLIFAPIFTSRQADALICFFRRYSREKKSILIDRCRVANEKIVSEKIDFPVYIIATIEREKRCGKELDKELSRASIGLDAEEVNWIKELDHRKNKNSNKESLLYLVHEYRYIQNIITIFKPKNMIIGGGWGYSGCIFGHLCEKYHIPYGYLEFGWLPGTFQIEPRGFAGLGESANLPNPETNVDFEKINEIKHYITSHKLDSSTFRVNLDDEKKLHSIDCGKKTVFLVGMDDHGMAINPESVFWKEYISSVVFSTKEAYEICKKICLKHHWNFLFKPHPNPRKKNEIVDREAGSIIFQDMQIDRLIENADVVVSIASAVNYKVLLYDKPLVQIGITCLTGKGCCYEIKAKDQIEDTLVRAMERGMTRKQKENFDKHLSMLLDNYLWDDLSERELRYGLTFDKDFPLK